MTIKYTNNLADFGAFTRYHLRTAVWHLRGTVKFTVYFFLGCSAAISAVTRLFEPKLFITIAALSVVWIVLYRPFAIWFGGWYTKRLYTGGKNRGTVGWHCLEITETGLRETSETGVQEIRFEGIERIAESPSYVFIYVSALTAHVVPKAAVTDGDLAAFVGQLRALLAEHAG
jgi:hypothetical protein